MAKKVEYGKTISAMLECFNHGGDMWIRVVADDKNQSRLSLLFYGVRLLLSFPKVLQQSLAYADVLEAQL